MDSIYFAIFVLFSEFYQFFSLETFLLINEFDFNPDASLIIQAMSETLLNHFNPYLNFNWFMLANFNPRYHLNIYYL